MPFSIDRDLVARGPGVLDMKGGMALLRYALGELHALGHAPRRPLRILFTADEETRSVTSRTLIEEAAQSAAVTLVLESPLPGGGLKTARKGTATYRVDVEGLAAHAGVEPEKGVNAVLELAYQIPAIQALADAARGTTVNVGVILAMFQFLRRMATSVEVQQLAGAELDVALQKRQWPKLPPGVMVYSIEGPFFFGAVDTFERALAQTHTDPRRLILVLARVPFIDISGIQALEEALRDMQRRGVDVLLCGANTTAVDFDR
jgi:hypothetical protein